MALVNEMSFFERMMPPAFIFKAIKLYEIKKYEHDRVKSENRKLKSKIQEMEQKARDGEEVISKIKAVYDHMKIYDNELKNEHTTLIAKYEHLKLNQGELKGEYATIKAENDRVKDENTELKSKVVEAEQNSRDTEIRMKMSEKCMEENVAKLQQDHNDKILEMEQHLQEAENKIAELKITVAEVEEKARDAEERQSEHAALKVEYERVKKENTELKPKVHRIEQEALITKRRKFQDTSMKTENDRLQIENNELQSKVLEMQQKFIDVEEQKRVFKESMEEKLAQLQQDQSKKVHEMNQQLREAGGAIAELNKIIEEQSKMIRPCQLCKKSFYIRANNGKIVSGENGTLSMACNRGKPYAQTYFHIEQFGNSKIALKSNGKYVSCENGKDSMKCNSDIAGNWQLFELILHDGNEFSLKGNNGKYVSCSGEYHCYLRCNAEKIGESEIFQRFYDI